MRTSDGKIVAAILWGDEFSLLESGLVFLHHFIRAPRRVLRRLIRNPKPLTNRIFREAAVQSSCS